MNRKFKNLSRISGLVSIALLLSFCSKDEHQPDVEDDKNEETDPPIEEGTILPQIKIQFAPISGVGENGEPIGKSEWNAEDQIKAFVVPSDTADFTDWSTFQHKFITDSENSPKGIFSPEEKTALNSEKSYDWFVMFPYSDQVKDPLSGSQSQTKFSMDGQTQDPAHPSAHLVAYDIMTAVARQVKVTDMPEFKMEHKCAMMKFNIKNNDRSESVRMDKIEFIAPEDVNISGSYSIDFKKGGSMIRKSVSNKATLSFKEELTLNAGEQVSAYIMMPPFTLKAEDMVSLRFISGNNSIEKEILVKEDRNIEAGSLNEYDFSVFPEIQTQIILSDTELFMKKGDKIRLTATILPEEEADRKIIWNSDHPEIAGIDDFGDIRTFSDGKATLTATLDGTDVTATCVVYVTTLNQYKIVLKSGESSRFKLLNVPEGTDDILWQTSAADILTVDETGNVTAQKPGYAEITATIGKYGLQLTGSVTVCPDEVELETILLGDIQIPMVKVEAGEFTMGATPEQGDEARDKEKPAHNVTLTKDYYIGMFEVTQELWNAVMDTIPSHYEGDISFPVEHISWYDIVQDFLPRLNEMTGKNFSLPTEAQWEFAARGGNKSMGYKYSGSDILQEVAWFEDNSKEDIENPNETSHDSFEGMYHPHNVGMKLPNELGLYDMSGNVYEWCQDWYGVYSYEDQIDPQGPETANSRVLRGGAFDAEGTKCRVPFREIYYPQYWHFRYGFRLVINDLQ